MTKKLWWSDRIRGTLKHFDYARAVPSGTSVKMAQQSGTAFLTKVIGLVWRRADAAHGDWDRCFHTSSQSERWCRSWSIRDCESSIWKDCERRAAWLLNRGQNRRYRKTLDVNGSRQMKTPLYSIVVPQNTIIFSWSSHHLMLPSTGHLTL